MTTTPRDPAALARLSALPLRARVIVEGALSGLHRARHHGSSIEFAEHKEYSPGDEIRHIDWRALAKHDRYYVKQFEQETQLDVYLVLDASGSMGFSSAGASKLAYAGELAAALAYLAIGQQDRVAVVGFGAAAIGEVVPARGRAAHLHDVLGVIDRAVASGGGGDHAGAAALDRVAELSRRRRSLIIVLSDLFDPTGQTVAALRRLRGRRHDVAVLHVLDPAELEFPYDGLTRFEGMESGEHVLVHPSAIRAQYLERMRQFLDQTQAELRAGGVGYQRCATDRAPEQALLEFLIARAGPRAGAPAPAPGEADRTSAAAGPEPRR
ncbi:MAG: DUF58 domain-containing protein [Kofleriaceae bacterium]|nr:DUF58 domain-containing protein [Kofleriaceae bacterium]MBP6838227.1 DUF58 domain-containing protein [Kofleriaceae bacterium]MBP9203809.1 DUF58 domain-containing protein [Kofleriaceae bacterium]